MYSRAENWSCLKPFCGVIFMRGWGGSPMSGRWGLAILLACWVDWGCQCPPECRHNQPAGCFEWFVRREHHGCLGIRDISLESPHASSVSCGFHPSHSQDSLRGRSCWCQPRAVGGFLVCLSDGAVSPEAGPPPSEHLHFEYMDCLVFNEKTGFLYVLKMILIWILVQIVEL